MSDRERSELPEVPSQQGLVLVDTSYRTPQASSGRAVTLLASLDTGPICALETLVASYSRSVDKLSR